MSILPAHPGFLKHIYAGEVLISIILKSQKDILNSNFHIFHWGKVLSFDPFISQAVLLGKNIGCSHWANVRDWDPVAHLSPKNRTVVAVSRPNGRAGRA